MLVLVPRVSRMNDFSVDDDNPMNVLSTVFVVSMVVPLAGIRARMPSGKLALIQCVVASVTCTVVFLFQPSGDGLYVLPVAMAALLAVAGSIIATVNVRRGSKQSTIRPSA